ncbi:ferritin-like domain-containing protein [Anaeromassilibacillus sp. Marseille-P3371]|uniref:ferritin-like domain-containing protein n=1 Tax=Anaeromassilibacillus sp. Marseille-P3371 TaxID=1944639 RepID=UPI000A1CF117|nr:ferritin-like domain-containing protein [Anaeromassilibacillus sp. Marseille-P3371]
MEKRDMHIETAKVYASPEPYPPIEVAGKNRLYAGLMHMNLCAAQSEMTAVMQYLYQGWVIEAKNAEASQALKQIAMVEMHHIDIFAQLICLLGGDPVYSVSFRQRRRTWDGNMVSSCKNFFHMMQSNLLAEQETIDRYRRQAAMVHDASLSAILLRIVEDEKVHVKIFRSYLDELIQ